MFDWFFFWRKKCQLCLDRIKTKDEHYRVVLETLDGDHVLYPVCDPCATMLEHIQNGVNKILENEND